MTDVTNLNNTNLLVDHDYANLQKRLGENQKNIFQKFRAFLEADRRRAVDVLPAAGQHITAFILHVERVSANQTGVLQIENGVDPTVGYFPNSADSTSWYKAYAYVDFYSSCLPLPLRTSFQAEQKAALQKEKSPITMDKLLKAFKGDLHSLLRISRFPYFLVPEKPQGQPGNSEQIPKAGWIATVKFVDPDNFSYGVFIRNNSPGSITAEQPVTEKKQPTPLIPNGNIEGLKKDIEDGKYQEAPATKSSGGPGYKLKSRTGDNRKTGIFPEQ